jgi:hypothetical protein
MTACMFSCTNCLHCVYVWCYILQTSTEARLEPGFTVHKCTEVDQSSPIQQFKWAKRSALHFELI